jgi:hypothetical protein
MVFGVLIAVGVILVGSQFTGFWSGSESSDDARKTLIESVNAQESDADLAALQARVEELERLVALEAAGESFPAPLEVGTDLRPVTSSFIINVPTDKHLTLVCSSVRETGLGGVLILDCGWLRDHLDRV